MSVSSMACRLNVNDLINLSDRYAFNWVVSGDNLINQNLSERILEKHRKAGVDSWLYKRFSKRKYDVNIDIIGNFRMSPLSTAYTSQPSLSSEEYEQS